MAYVLSTKIPPLKVTEKSTRGVKKKRTIYKGVSSDTSNNVEPDDSCIGVRDQAFQTTTEREEIAEFVEPSLYEIERKSAVKSWGNIRQNILKTFTGTVAMPVGQLCISCTEKAEFWCEQCGPVAFLCKKCFYLQHTKVNVFHVPKEWKGDHYETGELEECCIDVLPPHDCTTLKKVHICCLDDYGMERTVSVMSCDCEPLPVTLTRARLWPASPSFPKYAFTFSLMDWAEALLLECHVSVKDFCNAVYFKCSHPINKRRNVYSCFIEAFEEYRFFKHEMRHLSYLSNELDSGNVCPACPKENGTAVTSFDAVFGLPRKKSAGISHREPVHGPLFFCDQADVDEYVNSHTQAQKVSMDCNNFLAGNMLRSSTRFKALDETAVFGAACRHEFPLLFFNLKHGERLSYAVYMLDKLVNKFPVAKIYVMYDIACMLQKHLKNVGRTDLLERMQFCLPSFHSYGHKASCQIKFGPQRCEGIGMSDGEGMERLWSYLRPFSRMTKEMRPSHRVDVLAHCLVYYGLKKKRKMCAHLLTRMKRAIRIYDFAKEDFQSEGASEGVVQQWLHEESLLSSEEIFVVPLPAWKRDYFLMLHSYYEISGGVSFMSGSDHDRLCAYQDIVRLDKELRAMESSHRISHRWSQSSAEYMDAQLVFSKQREQELAKIIWSVTSRRQFLLRLKAKYADGQKIAKKLSSQISKESKKLKAVVSDFNACRSVDGGRVLNMEDALDQTKLQTVLSIASPMHTGNKRKIIDSYITLRRAKEEMQLLKCDIVNFKDHYDSIVATARTLTVSLSASDLPYNRGAISLLWNFEQDAAALTLDCITITQQMDRVGTSTISDCIEGDISSDSECDTDSDTDVEIG